MEIYKAYKHLKFPVEQEGQAGLQLRDSYPSEFQAVDLPILAAAGKAQGGDGKVELMGNNQAFFFVRNPKGNTDPAQMVLDTTHLKTLIENTKEWNANCQLIIDADVLDNPERFADKYAELRPEEPEVAKALLQREAQLIADFIKSDGVNELVKEVLAENSHLPADHLDKAAQTFVKQHFQVKGIECDHPLEGAVWRVDAPDGKLLAHQHYTPATATASRGWQLGTEPEVKELAQQGNIDALGLARAVEQIDRLPVRNLLPQPKEKSHSIAM